MASKLTLTQKIILGTMPMVVIVVVLLSYIVSIHRGEPSIEQMITDKTGVAVRSAVFRDKSSVEVTYRADPLNENDAVFDACKKAASIMPVLFKIKSIDFITVTQESQFADIYGNNRWQKAISISLRKREAEKVNWAGINNANRAGLIRVAEVLEIHQALYQGIDNKDISDALLYYKKKPGVLLIR